MADSTLNIHINTGGAKRNLDGVNASLEDTERQSKKTESSVDKLSSTVKRLAGVLVAGGLLKSVFTLTGNFQQLSRTLGVVYGSMAQGNAVFKDLQTLATETPFQIEELTQSVIKLKSAGLDPTKEMLATFADVASVTSDQIGTLQAVTDLFSRSLAGGLGLEDLNRLADRGIPVFKILQQELGLTRLEISEFGKTASGATTILKTLLEQFDVKYGGAAADAAKDLNAELSNLQIRIKQVFDAMAGGNATKALAAAIGQLSTALKFVAENIDLVQAALISLGIAMAVGAVAQVTIYVVKLGGLSKALAVATASVKAFSVALLANPFGLIAVSLTAALVAVYYFRDEFDKAFRVTIPNALDNAMIKLTEWRIAVRDFIGKDATDLRDKVLELGAAISGREIEFDEAGPAEWTKWLTDATDAATKMAGGLAGARSAMDQLTDAGKEGGIAKIGADAKTAADQIDEMAQKANSLTLSLRTSTEVFQDMISELDEMLANGLITMETYIRGLDAAEKQLENALKTDKPREELNDLQMAIEGFSRNAASSFVDMTNGVEGAFGRMVQTIIDELIRLMAQMLLFDPIFKSFGGWMGGIAGGIGIGSAGAGAGSVTAFGSGGVVSGATPFGFSGGRAGVAGEAGPEAILPLTRTSSGDLGVKAGGASPKVTVNVNNQTAGQADVAVTSSPSGDSIDIMITSAVAAGIAGGRFDSAFKSTYGLRRRGF